MQKLGLVSKLELLADGRNAILHPFGHGFAFQVVVEELLHAYLEIDPVGKFHGPMGLAGVVEQPCGFAQAFQCHKVFDTLVPGHMAILVVVHDEYGGLYLIHIK